MMEILAWLLLGTKGSYATGILYPWTLTLKKTLLSSLRMYWTTRLKEHGAREPGYANVQLPKLAPTHNKRNDSEGVLCTYSPPFLSNFHAKGFGYSSLARDRCARF